MGDIFRKRTGLQGGFVFDRNACSPARPSSESRRSATTGPVTSIEASGEQPLVNVCFRVRNWGDGGAAGVLMNGKAPAEVRQGTFVDTDGTRTMVIWIEVAASSPVTFTINGANPPP